ncbi:MAG: heat-inducible transcriptional repressor HrcA [Pseudomonadota bacterium]
MAPVISEPNLLNDRAREILRRIVDSYVTTGEPVGSRSLSRDLPMTLSPASVRNVMSDLEHLGLIYAPHTSAGRLPTTLGLRLFVDGLLEVGSLTDDERRQIESQITGHGHTTTDQLLAEAGEVISGLSECAGVVLTEKQVSTIKHIEFVPLEPSRAMVVLVGDNGSVENRIMDLPAGLPTSALISASNYLNAHARGKSLDEARSHIERQAADQRAALDELTRKVIAQGLAEWSGTLDERKSLIVKGQSKLLTDVSAVEDLERIRLLFDDLEAKRDLVQLLGLSEDADGVRIFIGSENKLFSMSGSSLVTAPFRDEKRNVVGVLGVIGPTRLNYARVIPMVDFTAKVISKLIT